MTKNKHDAKANKVQGKLYGELMKEGEINEWQNNKLFLFSDQSEDVCENSTHHDDASSHYSLNGPTKTDQGLLVLYADW